jgi:hypothetical protein
VYWHDPPRDAEHLQPPLPDLPLRTRHLKPGYRDPQNPALLTRAAYRTIHIMAVPAVAPIQELLVVTTHQPPIAKTECRLAIRKIRARVRYIAQMDDRLQFFPVDFELHRCYFFHDSTSSERLILTIAPPASEIRFWREI